MTIEIRRKHWQIYNKKDTRKAWRTVFGGRFFIFGKYYYHVRIRN